MESDKEVARGTQQIVSVNYLFGKILIPSDFLKRIFTSNFRDMKNFKTVVFRMLKCHFGYGKKVSYHFQRGDET